MKLSNLPCILAAVALVQASVVEIRGVNPKNYDLYRPTKEGTWSCLDGSKVIPYSAINDDYCDCPDGSDEPGTSACPNSYFYCANVGHIPAYIKSYAVNDGVCDEACCDGTDETNGLVQCPNRCKKIGEHYRKQQAILKKAASEGLVVKQQLIQDANSQINKWEEEKTIIEDEIVLKKSNILRLEAELKELESHQHVGKSKKSCPPCESKSAELDILLDDVQLLMDELDTLQSILADMKRDHNHNYHDMAVKAAINGYDEFMERFEETKDSILTDVNDVKAKNIASGENQSNENNNNEENKAEEKEEELTEEEKVVKEGKPSFIHSILEKVGSVIPPALKNGVLDKWLPIDESLLSKKPNLNGNQAAIETVRKSLTEAEGEIRDLNVNLDNINNQLNFDYGKDKEWLKLKDVCVEKNEGEYTYSICFLGDAYQKSNKDSSRTHLGKFDKYVGSEDSNDSNYYKVHNHNRGTRCWNGPERSVKATIECGKENEIMEVSEPEKCEYHYRMKSPAVCENIEDPVLEEPIFEKKPDVKKPIVHEEL